jgi:hypothetical protein
MKKNIVILINAVVVGGAFVLFVRSDILKKIPGFYCEGFGCMGLAVVYLMMAFILIPLLFGIFGFIFAKENRFRQAAVSLGISFIVMILSVWVIRTLHQIEVRKAIEDDKRFMREFQQNRVVSELPGS